MNRLLATVVAAFACVTSIVAQPSRSPATTVILVRHAEQTAPEGDMPLTTQGLERARALAQLLRDTPLRGVITSPLIRTKATAEPVATHHKLTPEVLPANDLDGVIAKIRSFGGGTILVVHHSNTVPALAQKLGGTTPPIAHDEFDRLLVVSSFPDGTSNTLTLRYGAPSRP